MEGNSVDAHSINAVVQVQNMYGDVHVRNQAPLPRMLPPAAVYFTDRLEVLAELDRARELALAAGVPLVVVCSGPGGIGKSELAVSWLRRIADEIPGAHLCAELDDTVSAKEILGGFLRSLGVRAADVPTSLTEMSGTFRSLTSAEPVIVLLDNVALASQVRPVVPNSAGSVVVATTRGLAENLAGAQFVDLGPLPDEAALELLTRLAGDNDEAGAVVALCQGRPLSLCAAGRQLTRRPVAREIRAERDGAGERRIGDAVVTSVFNVGYRGLSGAAADAYRCLGALFGRRFTTEAAAAATGVADPSECLAEMVAAGLVDDDGAGAYRMHDLAREHARAQATADEHESALLRVVTWYLRAAVAADFSVLPGRWWLGPEYERYRGAEPPMDRDTAWAWLRAERGALLAAVRAAAERGLHRIVVQLVEAQWSLCYFGKYHDHWVAVFEAGRAAAIELGDRRFEGRMRCQLGFAYAELGRYDEAAAEFTAARAADRAAGHVRGEATAVESLGLLCLRRSGAEELPALATTDDRLAAEALALLTENLTLNLAMAADASGDRAIALAWRHRGRALSAAGEHEQAIDQLTRARELIAAVPDTYNEGRVLTELGRAYLRAGRPADAEPVLLQALDLLHAGHNRAEEAVALRTLSAVADRAGDPEAAADWLRRALTVLGAQPGVLAAQIRRQLSDRS